MKQVNCDKTNNAKELYRNHAEPVASPQPPDFLYFGEKLFPKS